MLLHAAPVSCNRVLRNGGQCPRCRHPSPLVLSRFADGLSAPTMSFNLFHVANGVTPPSTSSFHNLDKAANCSRQNLLPRRPAQAGVGGGGCGVGLGHARGADGVDLDVVGLVCAEFDSAGAVPPAAGGAFLFGEAVDGGHGRGLLV